MEKTLKQYDMVVDKCANLFQKKMKDYGPAWRILRLSSLTDQIFIKANRIRSIQEKGSQKVSDNINSEFVGIFNYSVIALVQIELGIAKAPDISNDEAFSAYKKIIENARALMLDKNHDYDEAWRGLRVSSITDLVLQKLLRLKQIEDNKGDLLVSEGPDANYYDMINYAIFAMILIEESK